MLGKDLAFNDGRAICFSSERSDSTTKAVHGIDNASNWLGLPVPEVYSAELSEFVFAAGVKLLREFRPDVMYLTTTDYVQHKYAPGDTQANAFYEMFDRYLTQLDAMGADAAEGRVRKILTGLGFTESMQVIHDQLVKNLMFIVETSIKILLKRILLNHLKRILCCYLLLLVLCLPMVPDPILTYLASSRPAQYRTDPPRRYRAAGACGSHSRGRFSWRQSCCSWMSRRTTSTWTRCFGLITTLPTTSLARCLL